MAVDVKNILSASLPQGFTGSAGTNGFTGSQGTIGFTGSAGTGGSVSAYSTTIGNGSATSFTITHSLNITSTFVAVRNTTTGYYAYPDIKYVSANQVVLEFVDPPTTNQYTVSVLGGA